MARYHHLTSAHARLTPDSIDFVIECIRDAKEVLYGIEGLDARAMVVVARSVFEAERLFESEPQAFAEVRDEPRSDWTLACMSEAFMQAARQLQNRGAHEAAARALADWRTLLRRLVESRLQSPLLNYGAAVSALIDQCSPNSPREKLELLRRYLAEDLRANGGANVLSGLRQLGESHFQLRHAEIALHIFVQLVRYDPLDIWTHRSIADTLVHEFPEIALAAAERALLLLPRVDKWGLRPQLRELIQRTRGKSSSHLPAPASRLLSELRAKPGKRSRSSLRTLCMELAPEIERVPVRDEEPLPDAAGLAQLRRDLSTLPRKPRTGQSAVSSARYP